MKDLFDYFKAIGVNVIQRDGDYKDSKYSDYILPNPVFITESKKFQPYSVLRVGNLTINTIRIFEKIFRKVPCVDAINFLEPNKIRVTFVGPSVSTFSLNPIKDLVKSIIDGKDDTEEFLNTLYLMSHDPAEQLSVVFARYQSEGNKGLGFYSDRLASMVSRNSDKPLLDPVPTNMSVDNHGMYREFMHSSEKQVFINLIERIEIGARSAFLSFVNLPNEQQEMELLAIFVKYIIRELLRP